MLEGVFEIQGGLKRIIFEHFRHSITYATSPTFFLASSLVSNFVYTAVYRRCACSLLPSLHVSLEMGWSFQSIQSLMPNRTTNCEMASPLLYRKVRRRGCSRSNLVRVRMVKSRGDREEERMSEKANCIATKKFKR